MADGEDALLSVRRSASSGARSVTRSSAIVQDAVEQAVSRWEVAILTDKPIPDLRAWAFRVGANAALKLLARRRTRELRGNDPAGEGPGSEASAEETSRRQALRMHLAKAKGRLRGRQHDVLRKMLEDGMTYRRAARELGMTPGNVRRSFRSGLVRLRLYRTGLSSNGL